jgi:RNA polymerase-interacting CarD/CdnL/TRCF family regulator|tara:strand:- start:123 stop:413 length:291 start_codon:yes stop_codon:yes gene_type:complete
MHKILPIILILTLFSLAGCKKEKMYKVGQIVCVPTGHVYPYPIGEIYKITEEKDKDGERFDVYHIKLPSPKLKSHIIVRHKLADIREFIKIKEEGE